MSQFVTLCLLLLPYTLSKYISLQVYSFNVLLLSIYIISLLTRATTHLLVMIDFLFKI